MWPFGKRQRDYEGVGLALLQEGAKYQTPTCDGCYDWLEDSGQLQYRTEMTEKRGLGMAAAAVVVEHVLLRAERSFGVGTTEHTAMVRDQFYGFLDQLDDPEIDASAGRKFLARVVPEAARKFPPSTPHPGNAVSESMTYELVRAVIRLHVQWASGNGDQMILPTAAVDSHQLAQAGEGLARSQRWIETSVLSALKKTVKP